MATELSGSFSSEEEQTPTQPEEPNTADEVPQRLRTKSTVNHAGVVDNKRDPYYIWLFFDETSPRARDWNVETCVEGEMHCRREGDGIVNCYIYIPDTDDTFALPASKLHQVQDSSRYFMFLTDRNVGIGFYSRMESSAFKETLYNMQLTL